MDAALPPTVEAGHEAARNLLTDLVCYNDLVAVGAPQACADLGLGVPDDVAVAGFDDIPLAAQVTPPLTTCRVPRYEMGAQALELLPDQIDDRCIDRASICLPLTPPRTRSCARPTSSHNG